MAYDAPVRSSSGSVRATELVGVAEALLISEGPHALSLRRIADAAGTTTQSVYTEFGGKPGLIDALFRSGFQRLADRLAATSLPNGHVERLLELAIVYRSVAHDFPAHYELMTGRPIAEYQAPPASLQFASSTLEPLRDAVADAITAGVLRGEASLVAEQMWAAAHGHISLELSGLLRRDLAAYRNSLMLQIDGHRRIVPSALMSSEVSPHSPPGDAVAVIGSGPVHRPQRRR
jgi:AcrR family transcriptional regulator